MIFACGLAVMPAVASAQTAGSLPDPGVAPQKRAVQRASTFLENKGQWDSRAQFYGRADGADVWVTRTGLVFDYLRKVGDAKDPKKGRIDGHAVSMSFEGARPMRTAGVDPSPVRNDFFVGAGKAVRNVRGFGGVYGKGLYPGIDFRTYFTDQGPRWDVMVAPKADPKQVVLRFEGVDGVKVDRSGDLVYKTSLGDRKQAGLMAYQVVDGKRKPVRVAYQIVGKNKVAFDLGAYDRSRTLVIDPLVYGSYFGGDIGDDEVHAVTAVTEGAVYMTGMTRSPIFPAISGTHGLLGAQDAFITRFQGDAYNIDYNAYIGGNGTDSGNFIGLSPSLDAVWVLGSTTSDDLVPADPVGYVPYQKDPGAYFLMRFQTDPAQVLLPPQTTYLGGTGTATYAISAFKVSPVLGNLVIAGNASQDVPAPAGVVHPKPGSVFAYVSVFDPTVTSVRYAGYLGSMRDGAIIRVGNGNGNGLAVQDYKGLDDQNKPIATTQIALAGPAGQPGVTYGDTFLEPDLFPTYPKSTDIIGRTLFPNGHLMRGSGGQVADAYVAKVQFTEKVDPATRTVDPRGIQTVYVGLIGGSYVDRAYDVALDSVGNAYVLGYSGSFDFPRTRGVIGETRLNDTMVVTKVDPLGTRLVYSTGMNTGGQVNPLGINVDNRGSATITGYVTATATWPQTVGNPDAPNGVAGAGSVMTGGDGVLKDAYTRAGDDVLPTVDAFVNVLNSTATSLLYGSYIGANNDDFVYKPYVDDSGDIWLFGWTDSYFAYSVPGNGDNPADPKIVQSYSPLPATHLTNLAWKPRPDIPYSADGRNGAEGREVRGYRVPSSVTTFHRRDGYVLRFRIGLPAIETISISRDAGLAQDTAPGGFGARLTVGVALNRPALSSGAQVLLTLSSNEAASFSPSADVRTRLVDIAPGQTTLANAATIYTKHVTVNTPVQVRASYEGTFKIAQFSVVPWLQQVTVNPSEVVGGNPVVARVSLFENVPVGTSITVQLGGKDDSVISTTVEVASGTATNTQTVNTKGVDAILPTSITARADDRGLPVGPTQSAALTINPATLASLKVEPTETADMVGVNDPARRVKVTLALSGQTGPAGASINLTAENVPGITFVDENLDKVVNPYQVAPFTSTVTFYAIIPIVDTQATALIKAVRTDGTQPVFASLIIKPVVVASVLLEDPSGRNALSGTAPNYTVWDGYPLKGTVRLSREAPVGGLALYAKIQLGAGISVPGKIDFAEGEIQQTFTISMDPSLVSRKTVVRLSRDPLFAKANTDTFIQIVPITLSAPTFAPSTIDSGFKTTGTVKTSFPAPPGGLRVFLKPKVTSTITSPITVLVSDVTVADGADSATFEVKSDVLLKDATAVVTATRKALSTDIGAPGVTADSEILTIIAQKIASYTLDPVTVYGGQPVTGTVTLTAPAPEGGLKIYATTNQPTVAKPNPVEVTVLENEKVATINVETYTTLQDRQVVLTASRTTPADRVLPGITKDALPITVKSQGVELSLDPTSLYGGQPAKGKVTLIGPAPAGGMTVYLKSPKPEVANPTVPSVTIMPGQETTGVEFDIETKTVLSDTDVAISASRTSPASSLPGLTSTKTITVRSQQVALALDPTSLYGGQTAKGKVTITGPVPTGGMTVYLTSPKPTVANPTVPSVTVMPGQEATGVEFDIATQVVLADTPVAISASRTSPASSQTGVTATQTLTVLSQQVSLNLVPTSIHGGGTAKGTVTLTGVAPAGGITVYLKSPNPNVANPVVPTVTVLPGQEATGVEFDIATNVVSSDTPVILTASRTNPASSLPGLTSAKTLTVLSHKLSLVLNPATVLGGAVSTGTVTLSGDAPAAGMVIHVKSLNTIAANTAVATVNIPAGTRTGTFTINTNVVAIDTVAQIQASRTPAASSLPGQTVTAPLTVVAHKVIGVEVVPSSVYGGYGANGTVTLDQPAPVGGVLVYLLSNKPAVAMPTTATVTVAEGQTTATFAVTTSQVLTNQLVTITGARRSNGAGPGAASDTLSVLAQTLIDLSLTPNPVQGGDAVTGTVTINDPAPTGGVTIYLKSDKSAVASAPATVRINEGATSANFAVSTAVIARDTNVVLTASRSSVFTTGPVTRSATLAVKGLQFTVAVNPAMVYGGLENSTGTITLNRPAPEAVTLAVSASNTAATPNPALVTIPAGASSGVFTLVTKPVATIIPVDVVVRFDNRTSNTAELTVRPVRPMTLEFLPSTVRGTTQTKGTVTLDRPAPAGGLTLTLSWDQPDLLVGEKTLTIAAGQTSRSFVLTAARVSRTQVTTVSATVNDTTVTANVTVVR